MRNKNGKDTQGFPYRILPHPGHMDRPFPHRAFAGIPARPGNSAMARCVQETRLYSTMATDCNHQAWQWQQGCQPEPAFSFYIILSRSWETFHRKYGGSHWKPTGPQAVGPEHRNGNGAVCPVPDSTRLLRDWQRARKSGPGAGWQDPSQRTGTPAKPPGRGPCPPGSPARVLPGQPWWNPAPAGNRDPQCPGDNTGPKPIYRRAG